MTAPRGHFELLCCMQADQHVPAPGFPGWMSYGEARHQSSLHRSQWHMKVPWEVDESLYRSQEMLADDQNSLHNLRMTDGLSTSAGDYSKLSLQRSD
jgi:hypothetical protein